MLLYERIDNDIFRVKLQPEIYSREDDNSSILLNYFIPEYEMEVYIQLTEGKENAFNNINNYSDVTNIMYNFKIASTEWLYCKNQLNIEDCDDFYMLELKNVENNIKHYGYVQK